MTRARRFDRLERERPRRSEAEAGPSSSALVSRFADDGSAPRDPAAGAPGPGGPAATLRSRFEPLSAPGDRPLRVREDDGGQPFVRCASCRTDHHVSERRCRRCGADLTTREQRAFNEATWKRILEERAAEEPEVERLRRAAEDPRDAAMAERVRRLEIEMRREAARGFWDGSVDPALLATARSFGAAVGGFLRRVARLLVRSD